MTFFKGYLYENVCTVYLFISLDCYHVPLKLRELNSSLHNFTLNGQIKPENMQLLKHALWDTMNMRWLGIALNMNGRRIDLPENRNIPLWNKIKVRVLTAHKHVKYNLMIKQGNTWYVPRPETKNLRAVEPEAVWIINAQFQAISESYNKNRQHDNVKTPPSITGEEVSARWKRTYSGEVIMTVRCPMIQWTQRST